MPMRLPLVELVVTGISAGVQITLLPSVSTAERTGIVTASTAKVAVTSCIGVTADLRDSAMKAAIIVDIPFMRRLRRRK